MRRRPARAWLVVDAGFGDAGKGLVTDWLVRTTGASLVVRFNGGAQAGHNVVTADGRHHTFAQLGAGSFVPGVRTFLSSHVVVHPGALLAEAAALGRKGVADVLSRVRIGERARLVTPFHQAANRLRERARGAARHGSCGVGIGETVQDALAFPEEVVSAECLYDSGSLREKLHGIRLRKAAELAPLRALTRGDDRADREWRAFDLEGVADAWIEQASPIATLGLVVSDDLISQWSRDSGDVVYEGAQGVLLDEDVGFHPHTTWSRCTPANARELVARHSPGLEPKTIAVLRSHAVRHGAGPLPTESRGLSSVVSEHNAHNDWQGAVRHGWFDAVLARYALAACGPVDALAITHLDLLPKLDAWRACVAYEGQGGTVDRFELPRSLAAQVALGEKLLKAAPVLDERPSHEAEVLAAIEDFTGAPVGLVSRGPTASHVEAIGLLARDLA